MLQTVPWTKFTWSTMIKQMCVFLWGCENPKNLETSFNKDIICFKNFRGYTGKKLEDNIQCEIFETLLEEAQSSYKPEIVTELQNNSEEDLHKNIDTVVEWIERWKEENI